MGYELEFNFIDTDLVTDLDSQYNNTDKEKCEHCNTKLILDINNRCINCGASK